MPQVIHFPLLTTDISHLKLTQLLLLLLLLLLLIILPLYYILIIKMLSLQMDA